MKNARQKKILEIIAKNSVKTQDDLILKLKEEGFFVTQATVSRDIRELKLVKVSVGGADYKYAESSEDDIKFSVKYRNILKETLVNADYACNTMVLKTYPGMANAAAAAIDGMGWNEVLGTIAGDDTILMIMRSDEAAKEFFSKFHKLLEHKQ